MNSIMQPSEAADIGRTRRNRWNSVAKTTALSAGLVAAVAVWSEPAHATFIVDFAQAGSAVVANGSGSIDTADLVVNSFGGIGPFVLPSFPTIVLGPPNTFPPITLYIVAAATVLPPIGTGGQTFVSSGSGDVVGFQSHLINLPHNYVSGSPLADRDVWDNATFASLGLTPGRYAAIFGTGAHADGLQINVGPVLAPEPAAAVLFATALGFLGVAPAGGIRPRCNASRLEPMRLSGDISPDDSGWGP